MAFNGTGTFVRVHDWTDDASNAINIEASRMDAEHDGFATGLSTCITKDGQTTITADLPMAGFNHTGVGNAAARDEYAAAGQIQDQSLIYCTVGGTADAITLTPSPAITAYAAGQRFVFLAGSNNTTAVTVAISGLTTKAVTQDGSTALVADQLVSGNLYSIQYDGTAFVLEGGDKATKTQTFSMSWYIEVPSAKRYKLVLKSAVAGTITEVTTISEAGTATLTGDIDTTSLGGTANSVSNSEQSQAHASNNTFTVGQDIGFTFSSISGCSGVTITISGTITLD